MRLVHKILIFLIMCLLPIIVFANRPSAHTFIGNGNQMAPSIEGACKTYYGFDSDLIFDHYQLQAPSLYICWTKRISTGLVFWIYGFYVTENHTCLTGETLIDFDICKVTPTTDPKSIPDTRPQQNIGCSALATDKSISYTAGNEIVREVDYISSGSVKPIFVFNRTYNSTPIVSLDNQGQQWRNALSRSIKVLNGVAYTYRAGGKIYSFKLISSTWLPDPDINDKLTELVDVGGTRTGWIYTTEETGEMEAYDITGRLLSITDRAGFTQSLGYDGSNRIANITDVLGRALHFSYDASNRIVIMTNPAGGANFYLYSTDNSNNLLSVTYPDNKLKTYHYGGEVGESANVSGTPNLGVTYISALTGIVDENNSRYVTYRYDAYGRAYDEELAPDLGISLGHSIEHNNLVYNLDSSGNPTTTVVTDAIGSSRTYNFNTILGVVKSTSQSQPAGSGCVASAAAFTYDANGNVASRTDFKGNKANYLYDMVRNLETSRTEGLNAAGAATPATRTITTTWHPTWRLPLVTSEYTGATATGTALRTTTNVYDAKGNITSIAEADPARALTRTTTITYTYSSLVPGLVVNKVVNGPRTDVTDTTTYNYYDANATCAPSAAAPIIDPITGFAPDNLGCRGQLSSVTNALNQTTTYNRYNHHGQLEQMTDANGVITTMTYDLRQRLLSRTVGSETTTLVYDNVGQVVQLIMPDVSILNYTYDAAHRLTEVQDTLGNKVTYTLDAEGNRINEVTTDPLGYLAKTITRNYDALNRLQQVRGVE